MTRWSIWAVLPGATFLSVFVVNAQDDMGASSLVRIILTTATLMLGYYLGQQKGVNQ